MQRGAELRFSSRVTRRALIVVRDDQAFLDVSSRSEKDEIFDVVVKTICFEPHAFGRVAHAEVEAVASFANEIGVADFESEITRMWPKVVQLFERWGAIGMRVVRDERAAFPRVDANAG